MNDHYNILGFDLWGLLVEYKNALWWVYAISTVNILLYGVAQFHLLLCIQQTNVKKTKDEQEEEGNKPFPSDSSTASSGSKFPFVTIQLPVYNELYVVERLVDNVVQMDWPKDRYQVQILDDSDDETVELTRKKVEQYQKQGFDIEQLRRPDRVGYKGGNLKYNLPKAKGNFIAFFDADFMPRPDFLRRTMVHFDAPDICVVQTRIEYSNCNYNLLTRIQTIVHSVHCWVEQVGRFQGDFLSQFSGTAGVWRKEAIIDAGGWQCDTIVEDLDLSIRAQCKGWKIKFLDHVSCPGELPVDMSSVRSQQFRWIKGGIENARKLFPIVMRSEKSLSVGQYIHILLKLFESDIFIFILFMSVLSVPMMFLFEREDFKIVGALASLNLPLMIVTQFYANVYKPSQMDGGFWDKTKSYFITLPFFLSSVQGLGLQNTIAAIEGWLGHKSEFVRTAKFQTEQADDDKKNSINKSQVVKPAEVKYKAKSITIDITTVGEVSLSVFFAAAAVYGVQTGWYEFVPIYVLNAFGYFFNVVLTNLHAIYGP